MNRILLDKCFFFVGWMPTDGWVPKVVFRRMKWTLGRRVVRDSDIFKIEFNFNPV